MLVTGAAADPGHEFGTPNRLDLMVKIITEAGCKMSAADAVTKLIPKGFVPDETYILSRTLVAHGMARVENQTLILQTEGCL
ncbi:MAG: hypothetical protein AAFR93_01285 [Pseudomonadota bacterium]